MRRPLRSPVSRVLVITNTIPSVNSSAGEQRLVRMAAILATRTAVDLVAVGADQPIDEAARIHALRNEACVHVPFGGRPIHLARLLNGRPYALVIAKSWDLAELVLPIIRRYQPHAVFAIDTVDLHFLRDSRAAEIVGSRHPDHENNMARELSVYNGADIRIFVSDTERELYESFPGSRQDHNPVIPIIVDRLPVKRRPSRGEVVFVGPLWHPPNMDAVLWFCSDVWPQVRARVPDARLRLIGSNAWCLPIDTATLSTCPGVFVEGFVPDLSSVYSEACAVVAPLRFGAGMKGKVCEAMAAGVPVVTTSVGAEGIRARRDHDLLVADGPDAFARAVVSLLTDDALALSVGAAGATAIYAQCSVDLARPAVLGVLGDIDPRRRSAAPPRGVEQIPRMLFAAGWRLGRRLQAVCQRQLHAKAAGRGTSTVVSA